MLQPSTVYLNDQFISNDRASISPDDRGFYFADGVYEVIKFYKGKPFCFQEHLSRLKNSLHSLRISLTGLEKFADISHALMVANQLEHQNAGFYLQITRGVAPRTHRFPTNEVKPTVFARVFPLPPFINEMREGVMVTIHEDIRWLMCHVKSIALLPNTLIFEEAASQGAFECMLVRNGCITEATHSNIMAVKGGTLYTHPDSNLILSGVTKSVVLKLCKELKIPVVEAPINENEIYSFDEWFITGTGSEIVPVVKIADREVGNGKPGPVTRMLQKEFIKITYEELAEEEIVLEL